MGNQELFDKYIHGELSPAEEANFKCQLKTDKAFACEFRTFLLVVQSIQKEEQQDCADFGASMKNLSREQLQEIIGIKTKAKVKKNVLKFSPWIWSSLSAAAVIAIVITISLNLINQSQLDVKNAQYMAYNIIAEHNFIDGGYRGGANVIIEDFSAISEEELKEKLPLFETAYQQTQDELTGLNLAMIYLKLHNKNKALEILKELNAKYPESEFYSIIDQLEKI